MLNEYVRDNNKDTKVVTTVHDSILLDVPEHEIEEMAQVMSIIMENPPIDFLNTEIDGELMRYPIASDVEIGYNYADLVDFDLEDYRTFNSHHGYIKFYRDLHEVEANEDSKVITKEQADQLRATIEGSKEAYRKM